MPFFRLRLPSLLHALAATALVALAPLAQANEQCAAADASGSRLCRAGLSNDGIRKIAVVQEQPQWCWAASIAMIFAHHGYRVEQQEIVKDGYGSAVNLPAPSGQAMTNAMSRGWTDQDDRGFYARAMASDALSKQYNVSNTQVLAELASGRPLLIGALGHAMVLVDMSYRILADGQVRITGGTVIDPQPGRGIRPMLTAELRPTYVAAVHVLPATQRLAALDTPSASR